MKQYAVSFLSVKVKNGSYSYKEWKSGMGENHVNQRKAEWTKIIILIKNRVLEVYHCAFVYQFQDSPVPLNALLDRSNIKASTALIFLMAW